MPVIYCNVIPRNLYEALQTVLSLQLHFHPNWRTLIGSGNQFLNFHKNGIRIQYFRIHSEHSGLWKENDFEGVFKFRLFDWVDSVWRCKRGLVTVWWKLNRAPKRIANDLGNSGIALPVQTGTTTHEEWPSDSSRPDSNTSRILPYCSENDTLLETTESFFHGTVISQWICTIHPSPTCFLPTMPRILSNAGLSYDARRRSSISSSSSSASRRNSAQQSGLADWFSILTGHPNASMFSQETSVASSRSPMSSISSSGRSTPPSLSASVPSSRRQIISRRSSAPTMASYGLALIEESSWGQFVDTAEAEKELVRHSRVLSRKEIPSSVPLTPTQQHWSRHLWALSLNQSMLRSYATSHLSIFTPSLYYLLTFT